MIDKEYLGHRLIERGFKTWFLYMFKIIEHRPFIEENLHEGLFELADEVLSLKTLRAILNLPPRSSKTTLAIYLIAYSYAINQRCNFIYTSYSQDLLSQISNELSNILNHPIYRAMYKSSSQTIDFEDNPINEFWKKYLFDTTGKGKYSSKKIVTEQGGVVLFASIGSAITGFGAGIRGCDKFSGMLVIDDANKPADIRSQRMREKVKTYYQETLLSRLNDSSSPILNIQQRLHVEDLSGILMDLYKFKVLKKKLLNEDGSCNLPSQYTEERLDEIQKDNYAFISQYQQEPTQLGGNVIKTAWFGKYYDWRDIKPTKLFFTGDTAQKKKEHNDYTVFCAWFVYDNKLHLLDMVRNKMESPELRATAKVFWGKWKGGMKGKYPNGFYIEDKSSGTGLIQDLKRDTAIPVFGIEVEKDKLTRVEDVLPYIECGRVILPAWDDWEWGDIIQKECEEFARDDSHKHDDIIDNICMGIRKGLCAGEASVYDNI